MIISLFLLDGGGAKRLSTAGGRPSYLLWPLRPPMLMSSEHRTDANYGLARRHGRTDKTRAGHRRYHTFLLLFLDINYYRVYKK